MTSLKSGDCSFRVKAILVGLALFTACSTSKAPLTEAPPAATPTAVNQTAVGSTSLPAPKSNDVNEAVMRVFKDAATLDTTSTTPFVVGDFNGDQSQDLAAVIKPNPDKLGEMNEEYPSWILRDPLGDGNSKAPRLRVAANDVLLAIIHGYGEKGWHDPQATQTYLLKNVVGNRIQTESLQTFLAANNGKKLPNLRGDLLKDTVSEKSGYLYFASATYEWYDPATFTGETQARRGHGGQTLRH